MSHIARVNIEIRDLDALAACCQSIGLEFVRDQKTHRYFGGQHGDCLHAIRVKGITDAYEIGVTRHADGRPGWQLAWDSIDRRLTNIVGHDCGKLKQAYAVAVARKHAIQSGYRVQEQRQANGAVQLVLSK